MYSAIRMPREFYTNLDGVAADTVAMFRLDAGRYPGDEKLSALVGELSIRSVEFRSTRPIDPNQILFV